MKRRTSEAPEQSRQESQIRILAAVVAAAVLAGGFWIYRHGTGDRRAEAARTADAELASRLGSSDSRTGRQIIEEGRRAEEEATAEREENARKRRAEWLRVLRGKAEDARGQLSTMPLRAEDLARGDPKRIALGQAILDYGLALKESGARWEEWMPWIKRVEGEPDPIGERARTILDPKEEAARKAFVDGSDGHREQKPRFDEVR